ncbi:MAG: phasin family protein [Acidobacteriota bacterium]
MTTDDKKSGPFQGMPEEVRESANKIWLAGLGALSVAEEEGSKLFKNLVEKGKTWEGKGREAVDDAKTDVEEVVDRAKGRAENMWDRVEERLDESVSGALHRLGVPSRDEIATLTRRVEDLTRVVEQLKDQPAPAKKPAARKTAAKKPAARKTAAKPAAKTAAKAAPKTTAKTDSAEG